MKLHDLQPAPGSRTARTRVGRGIAAGKGKTAGRGTKGQKSRAGGSLPPWFEGGQTPLQIRVPKLRGFKNRFKVEYEVVNVGRIDQAAEAGRLVAEAPTGGEAPRTRRGKAAPLTINAEVLRAAGPIGTLRRPLKVLGAGDVARPLFVVADAFSASARAKIEAAGGTAQALEVPAEPMTALGLDAEVSGTAEPGAMAEPAGTAAQAAVAEQASTAESAAASSSALLEEAAAGPTEAKPAAPSDEAEVKPAKPAKPAKPRARKRPASTAEE
ncbi:MAG: 50S ribosomal protein L15 [Candidatus Limnocylindrales bacterium]